ncbi:hypothetical protein GCM10020254_61860 [Streptomyces goshikiensis]
MGLTQHKHSVATIREVVNLLLLRGNIGRPGAGVCPVRGHSNVQGDRTMGIFERPAPAFLDALDKEFGITSPRGHGYDVVRSIEALRDGKAKVLFAMGGNFVGATPDTTVTEAAIRRASLTVHVSTKLNRSHAVTGRRALILPTLGRTDKDFQAAGKQFVTVEDSMGMVHASRGNLAPRLPAPALRTRDRGPHGPRRPRHRLRHPVGGVRAGLRHHPRPDLPRRPRLRGLQRPRRPPRGLPAPARPARRAPLPHQDRQGQLHRRARRVPPRPGRPAAPADPAQPRPVQHHHLRPRRPLPRHHRRPPRRHGQPRGRRRARARRRLVHRPRQRMARRRRAPRARLPRRALPDRARLRGRLLPGDQRAGPPLDSTADTSNTPASKSVVVRFEPA